MFENLFTTPMERATYTSFLNQRLIEKSQTSSSKQVTFTIPHGSSPFHSYANSTTSFPSLSTELLPPKYTKISTEFTIPKAKLIKQLVNKNTNKLRAKAPNAFMLFRMQYVSQFKGKKHSPKFITKTISHLWNNLEGAFRKKYTSVSNKWQVILDENDAAHPDISSVAEQVRDVMKWLPGTMVISESWIQTWQDPAPASPAEQPKNIVPVFRETTPDTESKAVSISNISAFEEDASGSGILFPVNYL